MEVISLRKGLEGMPSTPVILPTRTSFSLLVSLLKQLINNIFLASSSKIKLSTKSSKVLGPSSASSV